jgi:hypothetical protein
MGARDQDDQLLERLARRKFFVVGNHTHSHVSASSFADPTIVPPGLRDAMFTSDICVAQIFFGRFQTWWHFFRAPGLDWPDWAAPAANANSCIANLDGPIGVDVGGAFRLDDGSWMGGDEDCYARGMTPEACGDLYLRDIRAITQNRGAIVLLHHYVIPGWYALRLAQKVVGELDLDIEVADIRAHPAFQGRSYPFAYSQ